MRSQHEIPPETRIQIDDLDASQRFQRALATDNPRLVRSAAADLPSVGIAEAAAMLLVIERTEPDNYERTALGWLAKLATEAPDIDLLGLARAAWALNALPVQQLAARAALVDVCRDAGVPAAAAAFNSRRRFAPSHRA